MPHESLFDRPTSAIVCGSGAELLNWVAYALARRTDPGFIWTDVRGRNETLAPIDPLARDLVPPERLNVVHPTDIVPPSGGATAAQAARLPPTVRRLGDFVRLPLHTQRLNEGGPTGGLPIALVLSNAQRMVGLYPTENVAPVVRTIVEAGVVLIVTFAGPPPPGSEAFDTILVVEGHDPRRWSDAELHVLKGPGGGPLTAGARYRLGDFAPVASTLASALDPPGRKPGRGTASKRPAGASARRGRSTRRT